MRPTSPTAAVLNNLLNLGGYAVWFGLWMYGLKYLMDLGDFTVSFFPFLWIPAGIVLGLFFGYVLRSVRKAGYLILAKELTRSRSRPLMEVGVWRLLKVAYRFWPQEAVTDFVGMAALHQVYDQSPAARRERLYAVVRQIESSPGCPAAPAAHDFLDEIGEEADRAVPDGRVSLL
jgi:hypothetical protein